MFGAELRIHFDSFGRMSVVTGSTLPDIGIDVKPKITIDAAEQAATRYVSLEASRDPVARRSPVQTVLQASGLRLVVFRTGLIRGVEGLDRLAWEIEVSNGFDIDGLVYVDAHRGDVIDRIPLMATDLYRRTPDEKRTRSALRGRTS